MKFAYIEIWDAEDDDKPSITKRIELPSVSVDSDGRYTNYVVGDWHLDDDDRDDIWQSAASFISLANFFDQEADTTLGRLAKIAADAFYGYNAPQQVWEPFRKAIGAVLDEIVRTSGQ